MFRLIRFLLSLLFFCAIVWFAVSVPLGRYTLWQHLLRISRTDEAKDLAHGARETAEDVARRVRDQMRPDGGPEPRHPHERERERGHERERER